MFPLRLATALGYLLAVHRARRMVGRAMRLLATLAVVAGLAAAILESAAAPALADPPAIAPLAVIQGVPLPPPDPVMAALMAKAASHITNSRALVGQATVQLAHGVVLLALAAPLPPL